MTATIALDGLLGDAVYLGITVAFFVLAVLLVEACRRIAGDDRLVPTLEHRPDHADPAAEGSAT